MADVATVRKILVSLNALLPTMNEKEIGQIAKVIYSAAERMEAEVEAESIAKEAR